MIFLNLFIPAVVIYFLGVYLAYFAFGFLVLGEPDENVEMDFWLWPFVLILGGFSILSVMIEPAPFVRFLRRSLFYLFLPFRPLTLGRLFREHLHYHPHLTYP